MVLLLAVVVLQAFGCVTVCVLSDVSYKVYIVMVQALSGCLARLLIYDKIREYNLLQPNVRITFNVICEVATEPKSTMEIYQKLYK